MKEALKLSIRWFEPITRRMRAPQVCEFQDDRAFERVTRDSDKCGRDDERVHLTPDPNAQTRLVDYAHPLPLSS